MNEWGELTPVHAFPAGYWVKREDLACYVSPEYPTGAKVRQYNRMAAAAPGAAMLVGCTANSAMQIYVAAAARLHNRQGIVYVTGRRQRTAATQYAIDMGAEVIEVRPGYRSVCVARARVRMKELGSVVMWNPKAAVLDTAAQCANLPADVRRVVVPVGTGAVTAGILAGLAMAGRPAVLVLGVTVSPIADLVKILKMARLATEAPLPWLTLVRHPSKYDAPGLAQLPDGTVLDPFYAAKAYSYLRPLDCLWPVGLRPAAAMPKKGLAP